MLMVHLNLREEILPSAECGKTKVSNEVTLQEKLEERRVTKWIFEGKGRGCSPQRDLSM